MHTTSSQNSVTIFLQIYAMMINVQSCEPTPKSLKVEGILETINHVPLKSYVMQS